MGAEHWPKYCGYCGIILTRQGQCALIIKILLVRGDIISWATGLIHYNARRFITLFKVRGDVSSWVRVTHEIHEH